MSFYMNMALNEGEQAEAYKRRKREEKNNADKQEFQRVYQRFDSMGDGHGEHTDVRYNKIDIHSDNKIKNNKNFLRAAQRANHEVKSRRYGHIDNKNKNLGDNVRDEIDTRDAILRHNRRHPDRYIGGIFSECNFIEFAY